MFFAAFPDTTATTNRTTASDWGDRDRQHAVHVDGEACFLLFSVGWYDHNLTITAVDLCFHVRVALTDIIRLAQQVLLQTASFFCCFWFAYEDCCAALARGFEVMPSHGQRHVQPCWDGRMHTVPVNLDQVFRVLPLVIARVPARGPSENVSDVPE